MAILSINIGDIPPFYDSVSAKLTEKGFPTCYGKMWPEILKKQIEIDDAEIVAPKFSGEPIVAVEPREFFSIPVALCDLKITQKGYELLTNIKEVMIENHVSQITACSECTHSDICYKISDMRLRSIELFSKKN